MNEIKNWKLFLALALLSVLNIFVANKFVINSDVFYNSFSDKFTPAQISELLAKRSDFSLLSYLISVVVLGLQVFVSTVAIYIGIYLAEIKQAFSKILKIVLFSHFAILFYSGLRLLLIYQKGLSTFEQIQTFQPLTLYWFFAEKELAIWLVYPLTAINLGQLLFLALASLLLSKICRIKLLKSIKVVLTSYGTLLALWITTLVFLQVYYLS